MVPWLEIVLLSVVLSKLTVQTKTQPALGFALRRRQRDRSQRLNVLCSCLASTDAFYCYLPLAKLRNYSRTVSKQA